MTNTHSSRIAVSPAIKFCGLTRKPDVAHAIALGAEFVGGIRAGGPRLLTSQHWRDLLGGATGQSESVAVFGEMSPSDLVREFRSLGAAIAQWHGDPTAEQVAALAREGIRVWPVLRVDGPRLPREAWALAAVAEALVLDARIAGQLGGTGVALDWESLTQDVSQWRLDNPGVRLVLAAGLHPKNVARAITLLAPDVVDVSSGVETAPGVKDPERMRAFVNAVRGRD